MLQEMLYLGPEQKLRRLFSSICVQGLYRAMIEENAGNPIANQKKTLRVKIISGHK
jgi:hypothetical protein